MCEFEVKSRKRKSGESVKGVMWSTSVVWKDIPYKDNLSNERKDVMNLINSSGTKKSTV